MYVYVWRDHGGTGGSTDLTLKRKEKKRDSLGSSEETDIAQAWTKSQVTYVNKRICIYVCIRMEGPRWHGRQHGLDPKKNKKKESLGSSEETDIGQAWTKG